MTTSEITQRLLRDLQMAGDTLSPDLDSVHRAARTLAPIVEQIVREEVIRAERASGESEHRFQTVVENVQDYAIFMLDPEGYVVSWNAGAERSKGYKAEEIIGQNFSRCYCPEDIARDMPKEELGIAGTTGRVEAEGWRLRMDGTRFWANVVITALRDRSGKLLGFSNITRDITERRELETKLLQKVEELKRSNEELRQFAYIASHDLQAPLRMVASYTQLLSSRYKGKLDSDADEFIDFAVDGANRMQLLIQDLLAYSGVETKGRDLLDTSSEKALRRALINLSDAIEECGALVTHDPLPTVQADEMQLVQLFQNLVNNGIKYQNRGVPRVHISAVKNDRQKWIFSVRDNGMGIDSQYFEKIFGVFQRLHKPEEFAGTGIGLAICKKIVERHGGSISVESQPGLGSTFSFALAESGRKSQILIVEDDLDVLMGMLIRLQANHYDTFFAVDAISSVVEAQKHQPDLILLDLGLPGGDGFRVMERLHENPFLASIPIIIVSGRAGHENQVRAMKAGAKAFLEKPVDNAELLAVIRQALGESTNSDKADQFLA
jgi:PAS domain S-box-containing protein